MTTRPPGGLVILIALLAAGAALAAVSTLTSAAGLLVADGGLGGRLRIEKHSVDVRIRNQIAVTEVTQVFRNTEDRQVEALYTFPVPQRASLSNFSMWVNGKEMVGEVVEKAEARQIYESYKPARRDPALLEQTDHKTFEMRIFPIAPRAAQKIKIRYYQELNRVHDRLTYVYPLAMEANDARGSSRWRRSARERTAGRFAMDVQVSAATPIVSVSSPSHGAAFAFVQASEGCWQANLQAERADINRDVVLSWRLAQARTGMSLTASKAPGEDGYFCLTLTAGEELKPSESGMDTVFVLDVSGSMGRDDKLALARRFITALLSGLGPKDRFEILTFNDEVKPLFGRLLARDRTARQRTRTFLSTRKALGGTLLKPALLAAYSCALPRRPLNVVLLSDGVTPQDDRSALGELIRARPDNARVFCLGFGHAVDRAVLRRLAEEGGGLAAFPSGGDDLQPTLRALRRRLRRPSARDVRIAFDGVEVYDLEPPKLGDLHPGVPLWVYGRYRRGGAARVTLRADVGVSPMERAAELGLPEVETGHPEIERMWAWHRVQRLSREAYQAPPADQDQLLWEIVRLGQAYSIVTQYTSFLVLENDAEYRRWKIDRLNALRAASGLARGPAMRKKLQALRSKAYAAAPRAVRQVRAAPTLRTAGSPPGRSNGGLRLDLPRPHFSGTPKNIRIKGLRPPIRDRKILVPEGLNLKNVALHKPVTSSDGDPIIGDLEMVTNGDKEADDGHFVELGPGKQWVQIDLKAEHLIYVILLWHFHAEARVYKDVVVQVANDPDFITGVRTLFNNDRDNSLGLGVGRDPQYVDDYTGEVVMPRKHTRDGYIADYIADEPVRARYVRFYSNGSTSTDYNHYTEVEIHGRRVD